MEGELAEKTELFQKAEAELLEDAANAMEEGLRTP